MISDSFKERPLFDKRKQSAFAITGGTELIFLMSLKKTNCSPRNNERYVDGNLN